MKRRRFLQFAASAAAGVALHRSHAFASNSRAWSLRLAHGSLSQGASLHGTVISLHDTPAFTPSAVAAFARLTTGAMRDCPTTNGPATTEPSALIEMLWEKKPGAGREHHQWIINGQPYTEHTELPLSAGHRYRLRMMNATAQPHPVHLLRHNLQVTQEKQTPICSGPRSTICLGRYAVVVRCDRPVFSVAGWHNSESALRVGVPMSAIGKKHQRFSYTSGYCRLRLGAKDILTFK